MKFVARISQEITLIREADVTIEADNIAAARDLAKEIEADDIPDQDWNERSYEGTGWRVEFVKEAPSE